MQNITLILFVLLIAINATFDLKIEYDDVFVDCNDCVTIAQNLHNLFVMMSRCEFEPRVFNLYDDDDMFDEFCAGIHSNEQIEIDFENVSFVFEFTRILMNDLTNEFVKESK